ncbi:sensor histidine kinase [Variovorax guangxiensis]|uniref:Signal transduction histidine kinase n=1 Tax=Variovorax guangxiensis TaxID=1775474 RepID=A0A840FMP8_9BURK|nr:histidine kinase [Variovorax guangxiensis]MBB4221684.1 signal transduction histidine kinase [Variovorax guangxiensis]
MLAHTTATPDAGISVAADALMVSRMRLVLSVSALLAVVVDAGDHRNHVDGAVWLAFCGYVLHSLLVYACTRMGRPYFQGKVIHWSDVLWFTLIIFVTDGVQSLFFLFYFFAILTSAFRWGFEEGARVTVASVASFAACGLATSTGNDAPQLLMRSTFLLALGHMIVHWGGSKLGLQRRLALLGDVSQLSNPRFGAGRTIARTMERTLAFFRASHCILLTRDTATGNWVLRTLRKNDACEHVSVETIGRIAESPLMALPADQTVLSNRLPWPLNRLYAQSHAFEAGAADGWRVEDEEGARRCEAITAMLEARAFISAPLPMRLGEGRVFVSSRDGLFNKSDALFLTHLMEQIFPIIETIEVLDRMASEAATAERLKFALNLHDTAVQPYIGLRMGLCALRKKATADNPLSDDLEKLASVADGVIADLRRYAGEVRQGSNNGPGGLVLPQLHRQAARIKGLYGIDIAVDVDGPLHLDDRMTAEVLQMVGEGLNNICKHTQARHGSVRLACRNGRLHVRIENEADGEESFTRFRPHSITERAAALGGCAQVRQCDSGGTAVLVEIPI